MNSFDVITAFVLQGVLKEPIGDQIKLYRALAEVTADTRLSKEFSEIADELQRINDRQLQLHFRTADRCKAGAQR